MAALLGAMVEAEDPRLKDVSELLHPAASHGSEAIELLDESLSESKTPAAKAFFSSLREVHDTLRPGDWTETLGDLVEQAFLQLARSKYEATPDTVIHHEVHVQVHDGEASVGTGRQSMDVVAWRHRFCCGELLEVKKDIRANTSRGFARKIRTMIDIQEFFAKRGCSQAFMGIATLATGSNIVSFLASLVGMDDEDFPLIVITTETVGQWRRQPVEVQ